MLKKNPVIAKSTTYESRGTSSACSYHRLQRTDIKSISDIRWGCERKIKSGPEENHPVSVYPPLASQPGHPRDPGNYRSAILNSSKVSVIQVTSTCFKLKTLFV